VHFPCDTILFPDKILYINKSGKNKINKNLLLSSTEAYPMTVMGMTLITINIRGCCGVKKKDLSEYGGITLHIKFSDLTASPMVGVPMTDFAD